MSARQPLSVTIITYNEERNLDRCLRSVDWADEIVVVDCGSTDRTTQIAARYGARVHHQPWLGYAAQKNRALEHATNGWVLSLDADEWLTEAGAEEIRRVLVAPAADAFAALRLTAFCGAFVPHVWSNDWQTRLFRKACAWFEGGQVHESLGLTAGARRARLSEPLMHLGYRSIHQYVERLNRYTDLAAASLAGRTSGVPWLRMLGAPPLTFLKHYLIKGGFRDGIRGFVIAAGSGFYVLIKYAKLWERRRRATAAFLGAVGSTPEDADPGDPGTGPQP